MSDTMNDASQAYETSVKHLTGGLTQARTEFERTREHAQTTMHAGVERAMRMGQDFAGLAQGNIEAMNESATIWANGMQEYFKHATEFARASFEEATHTAKTIAASRSVKDAVELQTSYAKAALEKVVAEMSRATDASLKLAERATAPVAARVTLTTEKLTHSLKQA